MNVLAALAFALFGIHVGAHRVLPIAYTPAWSPDGQRIAFVTRGSLWVADADGTPGYTDRYPAFFHGQNVALTGVPARVYDLMHRVNASMQLRELRYDNDAASVRLRLTWRKGYPSVRVLRSCPAAPNC